MNLLALILLCLVIVNAYVTRPLRTNTRLYAADNNNSGNKVENLMSFLADCEGWGECRFVVQGEGTILEAMGKISEMRSSANPKTGATLITLSNEFIPGFECHLRVDEINRVTHTVVSKFDKTLRVSRFLDAEDKNLLSVILGEEGNIESWEKTREKYGDSYII